MTTLHSFEYDAGFLNEHVESIVLQSSGLQRAIVVPAWQGRTMTSTARGDAGFSYGWVNYERIASGRIQPQINLFGGEDRFWISPEGSQFSFFFDPGVPMELANWRTPPELDVEPFELTEQSESHASFARDLELQNYQGSRFSMRLERSVRVHSTDETCECLGMSLPRGVFVVSHESQNSVTNLGASAWQAATGLPAVWILGMNKPSRSATVLVPFQPGSVQEKGPIVTADYFGQLDSDRLQVCESSRMIFFLGDGRLRSKLGVSHERAVSWLGAWDAERGGLTLTQFNLPDQAAAGYTSNLWQTLEDPWSGDVVNSYNDGPNESGGMMGPFYELETLSPALALDPAATYTHLHRTIHVEGEREGLNEVALEICGVSLEFIENVFSADRPQAGGTGGGVVR